MHSALRALVALALLLPDATAAAASAPAPARDGRTAEIVSLQGTGEVRPEAETPWAPAQVKQGLFPGYYVRTGDLSRLGILFVDETQVRLNQNSQLQIKPPPAGAPAGATLLRLNAGRAWTQSKAAPERLRMETPTALAAIRGTDWEVEVGPDGATTLTVLSGQVELSNELGRVAVGPGEQAVAEKGRAPVKRLLINARERVQWVTAYAVEPLHHVVADARFEPAFAALRRGDAAGAESAAAAAGADGELLALVRASTRIVAGAQKEALEILGRLAGQVGLKQPAAHLILSDLAVAHGDIPAALTWLDAAEKFFPRDARIASQRARVLLIDDRTADSRREVDRAVTLDPRAIEPRLAAGELALVEGEAARAEAAYTAAIAARPADDRGWFGRGAVRAEREWIGPARSDLRRALEINPGGAGYRGELATLETLADDYDAAAAEFDRALAANPSDYVALTGLGLLQIKRGEPEAALGSFLRAGVIEPRYARAHVWAAVASYQLGRTERALQELARASELDPLDPLPHLLAGMIRRDHFEAELAVRENRQALELMPYLKSLNQVATNQKGASNLGAALAFFGLEEWAQNYAQESFSPYGGGSHLFLADRYPDGFAKASEFAQGYLADPLAFGAGNRFQSLLQRPGAYGTLGVSGLLFEGDDAGVGSLVGPRATANGLVNPIFPVAWFLDAQATWLSPADEGLITIDGQAQTYTAALGAKPFHALGLFAIASHDRADIDIGAEGLAGEMPVTTRSDRLDAGGHFRFSPESQAWFKVGAGDGSTGWDDSPTALQLLEDVPAYDRLDYRLEQEAGDAQFRHTFAAGRHEITWGLETGRQEERHTGLFRLSGPGAIPATTAEVDLTETSFDAYLSDRVRIGSRLLLQVDLRYQTHESEHASTLVPFEAADFAIMDEGSETDAAVRPSAGLVFRPGGGFVLRLAHQRWTRPFAVNTLGPVATAGIVLDDRLVNAGGTLERTAARAEWEFDERTFLSLGVDAREVRNWAGEGFFAGAPSLDSLNRVRNLQIYNIASDTLLEAVPAFGEGRVRSASLAMNRILARRWSGYLRYTLSDSENTGEEFDGNEVPFVPEQMAGVGATWVAPWGTSLSGVAVRRSRRFADEENAVELEAGWTFGLVAYWETRDKRWSVSAAGVNLGTDNWPASYALDARFRF